MTEAVSDRYRDFDLWATRDMVQAMYDGQVQAIQVQETVLGNLARAIEAAKERLEQGARGEREGRLVYVGAGTSGRLAILDGAELGPTFGWPRERLVFLIAGGLDAMVNSAEGAEDSEAAGQTDIVKADIGEQDVVIGVAASGRTPYTCAALSEARSRGALCIAVTNNPDTPLAALADHAIVAITGSEIVAGSTRMKAGTAQKAILNLLSTGIMTCLGGVYDGLMVDMIPSNAKLRRRACEMVKSISGCSHQRAQKALEGSDWHIKTAVLVTKGSDNEKAKSILSEVNGNLRQALQTLANQE